METIKKRETESIFNIDGREFVITSYDPMEGNYILSQILAFVLPFGIGDMLNSSVGTERNVIPSSGKMMSKNDFMNLQTDILKTVYEEFPSTGNRSPVVRENRTYGVSDVTMNMLLKLIVASLAFNFKDFFKEVPSKDTFMEMLGLKSVNTET